MKISIIIEALTGSFETDMKRASREAQRASKQMEADLKRMGVAVGAAMAAAVVAVGAMTQKAINAADEIGKAAQKIGTGTEKLSGLAYAAKLADVELGALQGGLTKLTKNMVDGNEAFAAIGVSVTDSSGKFRDVVDVFGDVSEVLSKMDDPALRTRTALELLGKSGANLLPLMLEGKEGLQELHDEAKSLGLVLDKETTDAAEAFNDGMTKIGLAVDGIFTQVAADLLPTMNEFADLVFELATDGTLRDVASFIANDLVASARSAAEFIGNLSEEIDDFHAGIMRVGNFLSRINKPVADPDAEAQRTQLNMGRLGAGLPEEQRVRNLVTLLRDAGLNTAQLDRMQEEAVAGTVALVAELDKESTAVSGVSDRLKTLFADQTAANEAKKEAEKAAREQARALRELKAELEKLEREHERELMLQAESAVEAMKLVDALRLEADLIGLTEEEVRRLIEARQLESLIKAAGTELSAEAAAALRKELTDTQELIAGKSAYVEAMNETRRALDDIWGNFANGVGDALTDALFDGAKSGADAVKDVMEQLARDLVRFWLQQKIVIPLQQQLVGGVGGAGGGGGTGGLGGLAGGAWAEYAGIAMMGAGVGGLIGGNVFGGSRENSTGGAVGGAAGGLIAGTTAGATVIGAGLSAMGVGAALGSVVPIVGTIIGALIGAAIGELFETDPRIRVSSTENDARFETAFATGGVARDALPSGTATTFAEAITTFDNALAAMLGVVDGGAAQIAEIQVELAHFEADVSNGGVSVANILQLRFDAILSTFDEEVQEAVRGAGDLQAQVEALAGAFVYPQQIQAALDQLADASEWADMSELERQTAAINQQFDALVAQFETWGASAAQMAELDDYRADALGRLTAAGEAAVEVTDDAARAYADFVAEFTNGGGSAFRRALRDVQRELEATVDQANELARAAGLQAAREEDLIGARQRANDQIADLIAGLTETVIQQIAELYGTGAQRLEQQLADLDAQIAAIDRSDSGFGMLQALQREAQLGADRLRVQGELEAALEEEERIRRRMSAMGLAQNLADLDLARQDVDFEQLAAELGLNLDSFGEDLGMPLGAIGDFIRALEADSLTADVFGDGVQQIVDAIMAANSITDPKPYGIDDPEDSAGRGGKSRWDEIPTEPTNMLREEVVGLREELAALRREQAQLLGQGNTNTEQMVQEQRGLGRGLLSLRTEQERNLRRSDRTIPKVR